MYVDEENLVHYESGMEVHVEGRALTVRAIRTADKGYQVAFEEITDRTGAEEIRNRDVLVSERRELIEGEYWPEDLAGLEVRPGGGIVKDVVFGRAQDRLVIERHGQEFEIPFVDELVPIVDLEGGYVEVNEPEGITDQRPDR